MNIKLHKNPLFDFFIMCIDFFLCMVSFGLVRVGLSLFLAAGPIGTAEVAAAAAMAAAMLFMLYVYEFYTKFVRRKYEIVLSVFLASLVTAVVGIVVNILVFGFSWQGMFNVLLASVAAFLLISAEKLILLPVMKRVEGGAALLVIESKEVENALARKIKYSYLELYDAWYVQIDVNNEEEIAHLLAEEFHRYDSIFISPSIPEKLRNRFISYAVTLRKEIYILPDLYNISIMKNEAVQFDDTPAFRLRAFGPTRLQKTLKRGFDILTAFFFIVLSSPLMLLIALAVKLDSPGPLIFKQLRVTEDKKVFYIYKFRTMIENAEQETGPMRAKYGDKRITRVGGFLRLTRLDELPQFFNVLCGQMSVVGPRPERPVFVEQYCREIENYDKRFFVKAGLTGMAQVYSRYDTDARDRTLYDLLYIKDYSMWLDIRIILLTIKIMFVKEAAEGVKEPPVYARRQEEKTGTGVDR